jgi:hypothetical protein
MRVRPSATSASRASTSPVTTSSGTTGAGASAKSGTRNSWLGVVNPAPTGNTTLIDAA